MKNYKYSFFMIFLVMILAVSAVSAADLDDSSDADTLAVENDAIYEVASDIADDTQSADEADPIAADEGGNNFTSLQTQINEEGKTNLTLEKDYTRVEGDSDIVIDKDFTIDGQGKYKLDANNLGGIFKVNTGKTLTLKGLTLVNAVADNGGAVYNEGTLTVENCKFLNNTATYRGGAIYSEGTVNVKDSIFKDNDITYRAKNNDYGGAGIANLDGNLTVDNSKFIDNVKNYVIRAEGGKGDLLDGAAILTTGDTTITNSDFFNNSACYGGAFTAIPITSRKTATITIDNCNFTDNLAYTGGAMYIGWKADYDFSITKSWFENNVATGIGSTGYTAAGGAIESIYNSGSGSITKSTFKNNVVKDGATPSGSAVSIEGTASLAIDECAFEGNSADSNGGAVDISGKQGGGSTVTIERSNFTNNHATGVGGAVYSDGNAKLSVSNSKFEGNTAQNGTAIYNNGDLTVSDNTFGPNDEIASETQVTKPGSKVTIEPITNVTYGSPVVVYYTIENRSSNVTVSVSHKSGGIALSADTAVVVIEKDKVTITNLTAGQYVMNIVNNEDNNIGESFESAVFNVTQAASSVTIDPVENVTYGSPIVITYKIVNETSFVTISVSDVNDPEKLIDINATVDGQITVLDVLPVGSYMVSVHNGDDGNYYESDATLPFNVVKANANLQVTAQVNDLGIIIIEATVDPKVTGNITFKIINETGDVVLEGEGEITNGTAILGEQTVLPKGSYNYTVEYVNDNYDNSTYKSEAPLVISKVASELDVYSISVNEFGHIIILANVTKDATGNVTFLFIANDKNSTVDVDIDNGTVKFDDIVDLGKGHYSIITTYNGDTNYFSSVSTNETQLDKNHISSTYEAVVTANEVVITIKFPANATGNITVVYPSGYNYTMPINATVVMDISMVENGNQHILVTYPGDKNYYGFDNYLIEFFVKASSFINVKPVTVTYQNNGKFTVTLTDNNDGKGYNPIANALVTITINGKTYKGTTNAKGIATIAVPGKLVPKAYDAKVDYAGTAVCVGESEVVKFTVKKAKPKITAKKKTFKAKKKSKKYTITLKDNKKKAIKKVKVTIKVGKKTYTAKTNKKGKATFNLKKLKKKGTYKAKITFKGNKYFTKVTKTVKIKVKK